MMEKIIWTKGPFHPGSIQDWSISIHGSGQEVEVEIIDDDQYEDDQAQKHVYNFMKTGFKFNIV